jgi:competence protein CoiA
MQVALSETGVRCVAWITEKAEGPFSCPICLGEVILRKGKIREHHYAHKPPFNCSYGAGETQIHYRCKREVFEALSDHPRCSECEIEKQLDGVRPDVLATVSSNKIAIEVQKTNIDLDDIARKCITYNKLGIYVLWLVPKDAPKLTWHDGEEEWVCRPKEWEKYLHAMYYGRLYYWDKGLLVNPYHFNKFQIYVEAREWYDEYGDEQYAGGYYKYARALKRAIQHPHNQLNIIDDFSSRRRPQFDSKNWSIPSCNIWMDSLRAWWKKQK